WACFSFLFYDAATAEYSTLSLHDALPIYVVKGATTDSIKIRLSDGREITPLRVLADPETDVAVMPVEARSLVPARLGNSDELEIDRKSTRLNSSHVKISYAVFCLKKKKKE